MKCKKCSYEISGLTKFCPQCGEKVDTERSCPNCGELLEEGARYCSFCGYDIAKGKDADESANVEEPHSEAKVQGIENDKDDTGDFPLLDATDVVVSNTAEDKKTSSATAFKTMILLTFIIFFFPICTVSCAGEKITSPNAYEMAYNFGLNQTQMETLDMTIADVASPLMGMILILMVLGLLMDGTVVHTGQATMAFICMLVVKIDDKIMSLSEVGVNVEFTIWYNLSLITLFLAATAFLWGPKLLSKYNKLVRLDKFLSPAILAAIIVAVVLNPGIFTGIDAAVYNRSARDPQYEVAEDGTSEFESAIDDITLDIPELPDYDEGTAAESTTDAITYNTNISQEEIQYYIIPDAQTAYYTYDDLAGLSKEELRLARNEIYARHGRKFETPDLNEYFNQQPWYYGYLSAEEFDDTVLNEYEKANLDLIKLVENHNDTNVQDSANINWIGTYISEDGQSIEVTFCDENSVEIEFSGYSEEGWYTETYIMPYENTEKTQVSYEDTSIQKTIFTLKESAIEVKVLPSGSWREGMYIRQ